MLARAGRFWGLYKRAGHRVLVNANGDLIVRPTFIEAAAQLMRPWGGQPLFLPTNNQLINECMLCHQTHLPVYFAAAHTHEARPKSSLKVLQMTSLEAYNNNNQKLLALSGCNKSPQVPCTTFSVPKMLEQVPPAQHYLIHKPEDFQ